MTVSRRQPTNAKPLHSYEDLADEVRTLRAQIATAMDILEEIPGETLEERLKNLAAMVGPLEAAYRSAKT